MRGRLRLPLKGADRPVGAASTEHIRGVHG